MSGRTPTDVASQHRPQTVVTLWCRSLIAVAVALALAPAAVVLADDPTAATDLVSISADFGYETEARSLNGSSRIAVLRRQVTIRQANTVACL